MIVSVFGDYTGMKFARVVSICSIMAVSACHRGSQTPLAPQSKPNVAAPVVAKKGLSPEELTAGMVEAASQGKSQLAIKLKFDLPQKPVLGQPLNIDLAVMPQIDANGADIQLTGGDGLSVAPGANQMLLSRTPPGSWRRRPRAVRRSRR